MTARATDKIVVLSKKQAKAMIADGDKVHTFRGFVGADWSRAEVLRAIDAYECQLTGPMATAISHGLGFCDEQGWVFVQTKKVEK